MSDDLAARAEDLREEVSKLRLAVEQLNVRTTRTERATSRVALGAALLLILVAVLGWTIWTQAETSSRLENLTQRALCPVFALVIGGYDPSTRTSGDARDTYDHTFDVMRRASAELQCTADVVPPRTGA